MFGRSTMVNVAKIHLKPYKCELKLAQNVLKVKKLHLKQECTQNRTILQKIARAEAAIRQKLCDTFQLLIER
jgi:hypothetical protein